MSRSKAADNTPRGSAVPTTVTAYSADGVEQKPDQLAVEEPLEIRVTAEGQGGRARHSVAVTMRTPGHDFDLAAGFLFTEGVVRDDKSIWRFSYCEEDSADEQGNIVEVHLAPDVAFDPDRLSRNVYMSSSCGVCGKSSIDLVRTALPGPPKGDFRLQPREMVRLPAALVDAQPVFSRTGGLHAAALVEPNGDLLQLAEDVGRHNAVDKLIGARLLAADLPAADRILLVSGRASFELVQKALMAGIPALLAVGAPSSLAVELARELEMTLVGFLRDGRFNIYSGSHRVAIEGA
ncbi:MAG: formate dehydrogenase accessory sulfurtransferase FdhD [Thermoanaerobaculia bacterium]